MSGTHSQFSAYRERIVKKEVVHYIPPKFQITKGEVELNSIEQLTEKLAALEPETWFIHSPAGSGKTSLAIHLMLHLLAQGVGCVLITASTLKHHAKHTEAHDLVLALQPTKVDETLWQSRAKKKRGNIVIILDGINDMQREFFGKSQWEFITRLLNSNHKFPVLATSRYLPEELDPDDVERDIYLISLRPFNDSQIRHYLEARSLNAAQILDEAAAAGMQDAASNPFLLSLIADHYAGTQGGFAGDWPRSRAELLQQTSRVQRSLNTVQKTYQEQYGLSQEAVFCAASLTVEVLNESVVPLNELKALLQRVWTEQSEVIDSFVQDFLDLYLVDYTQEEGWRLIHDSLLEFGLALACVKRDPDIPPTFAFITGQFDTMLGDWVGLHPEPESAVKYVIERSRIYVTPEKLIDVALANRGILDLDTQNALWQAIGNGLLSARRVKSRVADLLGDLPLSVLKEALRHGLLRAMQKEYPWLAEQVEKALRYSSFNQHKLVSLVREYNRRYRSNDLPKNQKRRKNNEQGVGQLSIGKLEKFRQTLADTLQDEKQRRRAVMGLQKAPLLEVSTLLISLLENDPHHSVRGASAIVLGILGDHQAVEALSKALLGDVDPMNRGAAATALGQISDRQAVEALSTVLLHAETREDIRGSAATALGQIGDRQAVEALSTVLLHAETREDIRGSAATALGQIGDRQAVEALSTVLLHAETREDIRGSAATALGQIGDRQAVEALSTVLLHAETRENIRGSAATALGQIGDRQAVETLSTVLLHAETREDIRGSAATALGQIGDRQAVEALSTVLLHAETREDIRGSAATALGQIGDRQAVEALSTVLLHAETREDIRGSAATALGQIGDRQAVEVLSTVLLHAETREDIRGAAATALGQIGDRQAVEVLSTVLLDAETRESIRGAAATALGQIGDRQAVEVLSTVLLDAETRESIRGAAATALGQIGDRQAVEVLSTVLLDAETRESIRGAAATALGQIGDRQAVEVLSTVLLDAETRESIRGAAATALGQIGDRQAVEVLSTVLLDAETRESIRGAAATALGQIGDRQAVEALSKALLDDSIKDSIRFKAAIALGKTQNSSAIKSLCNVFSQATTKNKLRKAILIAFRELRSKHTLDFLKSVIESSESPSGLRIQSLTTYIQISKKIEAWPWLREIGKSETGKNGNKVLRGKIVKILSRYSEDQEDFTWLHQVARFDYDYECRTEAIQGLARVNELDTPLLRYLIDPDYHRKDKRLRDTDRGVRGQVGAEIIRRLGTATPPEAEHLQLVVEMLADSRDTHSTVITTALNPLVEMPLDKATQALEKIQSLVPRETDERFLKRLERYTELIKQREEMADSLEELHSHPEQFLIHFWEQAQPRLGTTHLFDTTVSKDEVRGQSMSPIETSVLEADVVIITAVKNESRAFLGLLKQQGIDWPTIPIHHQDRFYWPFELSQNIGHLKCALAQTTIKGAQGSQALMSDILRDIQPKLIIMVGVCGGFDERGVKINDVIAAYQVFHYERARIREDGSYEQPQVYRFSAKFMRLLEALDAGFTLDAVLKSAKLHIKDFAAGDKVLMQRDSNFRRAILKMSDDIVGIEMEGHGFLHEAWETASRGHVEVAMIKGVSDLGDEDKDNNKDERQQIAATRASQVVLELLKHSQNIFSS